MNNKRRTTALLTKSCVLCLIIVLVGCTPVTAPPPKPINSLTFSSTLTNTSTETLPPLFSVYVPMKTPQRNEAKDGFFLNHQMMTGPHEDVDEILSKTSQDGLLIEECNLNFLNIFSVDLVNEKVTDRIVAVNESRNEQDVFTDPGCLASPVQNSEPGGLQNSGGGGGGGRRSPAQGML